MCSARGPKHLRPHQRAGALIRVHAQQPAIHAHHAGSSLVGEAHRTHHAVFLSDISKSRSHQRHLRIGERDGERRAPLADGDVGEARRVESRNPALVAGLVEQRAVGRGIAGHEDRGVAHLGGERVPGRSTALVHRDSRGAQVREVGPSAGRRQHVLEGVFSRHAVRRPRHPNSTVHELRPHVRDPQL